MVCSRYLKLTSSDQTAVLIFLDLYFQPPKPAIPEMAKPSLKPESKVDFTEVKRLHDELNNLKNSLESITKQFKEHVDKNEKQMQRMEKKFMDEIEDLTKELDEEKKLRSSVDVEVKRLRKLLKNQSNPNES